MSNQQNADIGAHAERPSSDASAPRQMGGQMGDGRAEAPRAPRIRAAFGTGGGAAIVFSDLASI